MSFATQMFLISHLFIPDIIVHTSLRYMLFYFMYIYESQKAWMACHGISLALYTMGWHGSTYNHNILTPTQYNIINFHSHIVRAMSKCILKLCSVFFFVFFVSSPLLETKRERERENGEPWSTAQKKSSNEIESDNGCFDTLNSIPHDRTRATNATISSRVNANHINTWFFIRHYI